MWYSAVRLWVVNTANRHLPAYHASTTRSKEPRKYVANGELGVFTGQLKSGEMRKAPWQTQVEFSSQPGWRITCRSGSRDEPALELAWALTIHKSQGSEFGTVILMLPAQARASPANCSTPR
ncbi:ATP-binding domain-containing protein [Streptomyces sp. NPDC087422]|uniref:ATP-binding domain-containing protein n=1 Tax=Streptomyces sp. NPDC087422 TaxID=3365786 RepID=UPI0037F5CA61